VGRIDTHSCSFHASDAGGEHGGVRRERRGPGAAGDDSGFRAVRNAAGFATRLGDGCADVCNRLGVRLKYPID
jgi:hypothetical protein